MKKIICLYGGPGSGKSTMAAKLFYIAKERNINCELVREYIKNWVWEDRKILPGDQSYFFAKQSRLERILILKKVNLIITDCPLAMTHYYSLDDEYEKKYQTSLTLFKHHTAFCEDHGYSIDHLFIQRSKKYQPEGRLQTEEEAIKIDHKILSTLIDLKLRFNVVNKHNEPYLDII